ncbi:uncharacterized protein BJ212DRAFT_1304991 [Suillus subaureus]|uniref:Fungal-type protein kinase domain-containing protein n=1 Tax=Suillus subaureus TaxID=48587 RepID=A0A9P7DS80_9AGAM|nr:uncharacterized protein BJ212DRAFT_1304991 [Suillus subaureus]KAG1801846.1 hypothetical protein BJ212DRAFT_1304991 [Suillus subaureus]
MPLPQPVSTTSYRKHLYGLVSTCNALPEPQNKIAMDKLLEEEFIGTVLWEEKLLPKDAKSVMDTLILQTNFTPASLNKIYYFKSGPGGKRVKSGSIFQPAVRRGTNAEWLFDNRNVQPRLLVDSRKQKKKVQMSMVSAMLTDTEVEILDSSFTMPDTNKSFSAKGYDDKHPSKKQPQASVMTEGKWTLLFNVVQAAMHVMYKKIFPNPSAAFPFGAMNVIGGPPKCIWSSQFCNTPILDDTNVQKPDVILVDCNLHNLSLRWSNIITCMEYTESELDSSIPLYYGSSTKGYLLMQEQPWRQFILIFTITNNLLHLHYFDHSGLIISHPINILKNPVHLLKVLNTLTLAHTNNLGYNPTMHMCDPAYKGLHANLWENTIGWIENHDKSHLSIMSMLWQSQGFFSCGTICYHVQTSDGMEYVLKDCWVAEDKKNHKVTILKMVEGILNVVKLMAHWDVLYNGVPDCIFHWCLLLTPCREPLVFYSLKLELLRAFHDFVLAHSLMLASHVLHRDLSPNNFIIHDGQEGAISVPSEGMGTRPYMSICLLQEGIAKGAMIQHTASDDLESLFFIFVEFATTFNGPHYPA